MNSLDNSKEIDPSEKRALDIGKIIWNLQALEFALRVFLYKTKGPEDPLFTWDKISVGEKLRETAITNFASLGDLIKEVNDGLKNLGIDDQIDSSLVTLRDAIAHGRSLSKTPLGIPKLFKFTRPDKKGFVKVITAVDVTPEWLKAQKILTLKEFEKIYKILKTLQILPVEI